MSFKLKQITILTLCTSLICCMLSSCSSTEQNKTMGRYIEENYNKPEEFYEFKMIKLSDGKIAATAYTDNYGYTGFISEDNGETWCELTLNLPTIENKEVLVNNFVFLSEDKNLISYAVSDPLPDFQDEKIPDDYEFPEPELFFGIADNTGNIEIFDLDIAKYANSSHYFGLYNCKADNNGDFYFQAGENLENIIQFDGETLTEKNIFSTSESINDFFIISDLLVVTSWDNIIEYDINTGKESDILNNLIKIIEKDENYYPTFINAGSDTNIYYYSQLGLYCYNIATKKSELLIDGALSDFGNNYMELSSLIEKDNGELLAEFFDSSNGDSHLVNFVYNPDIPSKPEDTIVIYSLIDDSTIRLAISKLTKSNPDIYVKFEVGLDENSGMTKSDALKTLNTEIMAGDGPDILILDNLDSNSYIEKGLLEDISDTINPLVENGNLFKSIAHAYTIDNKIYEIPLYFKYPILLGNSDDISNISDLSSLVNVAKKYTDLRDQLIFSKPFNSSSIVYSLYCLYGDNWLNEDNTINEGALRTFFTEAKELCNICTTNEQSYMDYITNIYGNLLDNGYVEDSLENEEDSYTDELYTLLALSYFLMPPLQSYDIGENGTSKLAYGSIDSAERYSIILSTLLQDDNMDYKVLNGSSGNIFIPKYIFGISSKSKNKDSAKKLIESLFDPNNVAESWGVGITTNKNSLINQLDFNNNDVEYEIDEKTGREIRTTMYTESADGKYEETILLYPNKDDINSFINEIESLSVKADINIVLLTEVSTQFQLFANDQIRLDEAINNIVNNLELYLSE